MACRRTHLSGVEERERGKDKIVCRQAASSYGNNLSLNLNYKIFKSHFRGLCGIIIFTPAVSHCHSTPSGDRCAEDKIGLYLYTSALPLPSLNAEVKNLSSFISFGSECEYLQDVGENIG